MSSTLTILEGARRVTISHSTLNVYLIRGATLREHLNASHIANCEYHLEGERQRLLRRAVCTPGTRVRILDNIKKWANDISSESQTVYWLFGPAGSGKTTIAYTIAHSFKNSGSTNDEIILGGNFFCSRQFEETRLSGRIIPTIIYHLALKCNTFAEALINSNTFESIHSDITVQLEDLLIKPWKQSAGKATPRNYLVVIDALDEIEGGAGSTFLRTLLDAINKHRLPGLKFFVTSRQDPDLVKQVESLKWKELYRLQEVPFKEAQDDIRKYLRETLRDIAERPEMEKLVEQAGGLFIYAATIVRYLEDLPLLDQEDLLNELLSIPDSAIPGRSTEDVPLLDKLYHQILQDAFRDLPKHILARWLQVLHTLLCSAERISTSVTAVLLTSNKIDSFTQMVNTVLNKLHAVLYSEGDRVLWYHKSFPDFIFTEARSKTFWCDQKVHHRCLTNSCFRVMEEGLKFNIANIASSFVLDRDNPALAGEIEQKISSALSYSCRNWHQHLSLTTSTASDPLCKTLSDFLQLRALFWIEAMNLLGLRGLCDPMLQTACEWVQTDSTLAEQFAEAASFAVYFTGSGASLSTPHLYISALATWPWNLDPCRSWRNHFPGLPGFTNISRGDTLLMTLRVGSSVNAVVFSSNGRCIVSGSNDGLVRVWDVPTGDVLKVLKGHRSRVTSVAFSSNGRCLASGSSDTSVQVWDSSTGEVLKVLGGHTDWVTSVAFSSNGEHIISGSRDRSVRVWSALTGEVLKVLRGHTDSVTSVTFSKDGRCIVSGSGDKSVRVWDSLTGEALKRLQGHVQGIRSVAISSDGSRIVSGSDDKSVRVWDSSTGEVLKVLEGHEVSVTSVALSRDGKHIVCGSGHKSVWVWDSLTGQVLKVLEGHTDSVMSVAFSGDGKRIVSGSMDETLRMWDSLTGKVLRGLEGHTEGVTSVAFSSDGRLVVSGSSDKSVRVWDSLTGKVQKVLEDTSFGMSVAFSSNGSYVVSGSHDKSVRVWDSLTGEVLKVLKGHKGQVTSVAFSTDGKCIASGSYDNSVLVWDSSTGKVLKTMTGHIGREGVTSIAFSPDGKHIVSGDKSGLWLWDLLTGKKLKELRGHSFTVTSVAFSGDGKRIVSGSVDKSVRVWDSSSGQELKVFKGHTLSITSVASSRDGKLGQNDTIVGFFNGQGAEGAEGPHCSG